MIGTCGRRTAEADFWRENDLLAQTGHVSGMEPRIPGNFAASNLPLPARQAAGVGEAA